MMKMIRHVEDQKALATQMIARIAHHRAVFVQAAVYVDVVYARIRTRFKIVQEPFAQGGERRIAYHITWSA